MATVGDRLSQVLKLRGDISARELDRRAALSEGTTAIIIKRYEKNPRASTETGTLEALARGGAVSERWLILGQGTPGASDEEPSLPPPGPTRPELQHLPGWADALALARQEHPDWPAWVWQAVGEASPLQVPAVTLGLLEDTARLVMRHAGLGQRGAETVAARTAHNAKLEEELARAREGTEEERPPPSAEDVPKTKRRRKE